MQESKITSRKFWLAVIMLIAISCIFVVPSIFNTPLLLTGSEFVSLILGIFTIYSTANVAQRHVDQKNTNTNTKPFLDSRSPYEIRLK